jgi:hypothetical protein
MLFWLTLLAAVPLTSAQGDQLTCAIDGAGALDSTVNAGVYLWAASVRCPKGAAASDDVKCEIDVTSAVQAVTQMSAIIAKAADTCSGDINTKHAQCGQAAASLISATSGLAAGAGDLAHWIMDNKKGGNVVIDATTLKTGKCVMNVKSVVNDIFQAAAAIKAAKADCASDGQELCAAKSLGIISILSNFGAAIAHAVAFCSPTVDKTSQMSGDIIGLQAALDAVAQAGIAVHQKCSVDDSRLYAMPQITSDSSVSMSSFVAFTLIPIAAVLGFVGGKRIKAARGYQQTPDVEGMAMMEE